MKKLLMLIAVVGAVCLGQAGETSTLIKTRVPKGSAVEVGKWNWGFSACKKYAEENKVPLIAVWSNGDSCPHCIMFESACNSSTFKNWMASSGCVFYFTYPGDGGEGKAASSTFHWIRKNTNVNYPFVRIYWPKGKVDVATIGDVVDGKAKGSTGGKNVRDYIKGKIKGFDPVKVDPELPYSIAFDANFPTTNGTDGAMEQIDALYGTATNLPVNAFVCSNYTFSGWAKSATGSVAYKNGVAVKGLTSTSNAVVTLYARWTRMTYGPYYTGIKKTIKVSNYKGTLYAGYKPTTKIAGLTWNTKGYWTGTPTKAGTYTITFKKSSSSIKRTFVIVKDAVLLDGLELDSDNTAWTDTSVAFDQPITAVSGDLTSVTVSGLPEGLSYRDGKIVGRAKTPGLYTITVSGKTKNSQTVKKTFSLEVEEGNALLLNGMAHADEVWTFVDEPISYTVSVKIKKGDSSYELRQLTEADVVVTSIDGAMTVDGFSVKDGVFAGTMTMGGAYLVTITGMVDDEEIGTTFTLNVLESQSEGDE